MTHIWRKVYFWVWPETVRWGWTVADIVSWFEKTDSDFQDRYELGEDNGANGSIVEWTDVFLKQSFADWKLEWALKMNSISSFLLALLWEKITTANADDTFSHLFNFSESNTHQSLVVAKETPIEKMLYKLSMIKSFEISAEIWEIAKVTINLESKPWVEDWTITKNFELDHNFLSRFWIFKLASTYSALWIASAMDLRSFKLTFTPNTEKRGSLWDTSPVEIINKTYNITWTVEFDYKDNIVKDIALSTQKKALQFAIVDDEKIIWTWTRNPKIDFKFYRVAFTSYEVSEPNDDVVTQSLNFKALYDFWNNATLTCDLVNTLDF